MRALRSGVASQFTGCDDLFLRMHILRELYSRQLEGHLPKLWRRTDAAAVAAIALNGNRLAVARTQLQPRMTAPTPAQIRRSRSEVLVLVHD